MNGMDDLLALGREYWYIYEVQPSDTAEVYGSGSLPVLATPRVVTLLERAARACVDPDLPEGMTTVGTRISLDHVRASGVGSEVRFFARLDGQEGRKYIFTVRAESDTELLAEGVHERFAVDSGRFMSKVLR